MRLAVISDLHSNIYALSSVLKDIETKNVDAVVCTGDLVGYFPHPNEVIDLVRKNKILSIKGNHDERISKKIKPDNLRYLQELPESIEMTVGQYRLLFVHGSPKAIDDYMYADSDSLEDMVKAVESNVIVSGHTHIPYHIQFKNKELINAGSVGKPKSNNGKSTYVIIDISKEELTTEILEVAYEVDRLVSDIRSNAYISDALIPLIQSNPFKPN